jgi:3-oxoacyl-[acyl-carrier protein] reductase
MDLGVKDKAFVIVGGTRDMGFEAARVLAGDGAAVALLGRGDDRATAAAKEITAEFGTPAVGHGADGSRPGAIEEAISESIRDLGRVDGLLTTAGWVHNNGTVLEASDADFDDVYQNIFMTAVRSCRAVLPHLIEGGGGTIVTTSAYSIHSPKEFLHAYSAMKHALANFTKNVAKTYGHQGIRANCVCPGAIKTATLNDIVVGRAAERAEPMAATERFLLFEEWAMPVALERLGQPRELGEMMAFLLSDRSAYTTGATINVDGGTDF